MTPGTLLLLAVAGLLAGFVDSIAGGGGLLTVPALLAAGLPPVTMLGTNKLQSTFGTVVACVSYARAGHIDLRASAGTAAFVLVGAATGALAAGWINPAILAGMVPLLLIAIALWFLFAPNLDDRDRARRLPHGAYGVIAAAIGFYDGVFGPGTGAFFTASMVGLLGFGLLRATAAAKLLNGTSNLVALIVLAAGGHVLWQIGLIMMLANMAGNRIGALMAMRIGTRLIRPLLVTVSIAMTLKLLADPANPLRIWIVHTILLPLGLGHSR